MAQVLAVGTECDIGETAIAAQKLLHNDASCACHPNALTVHMRNAENKAVSISLQSKILSHMSFPFKGALVAKGTGLTVDHWSLKCSRAKVCRRTLNKDSLFTHVIVCGAAMLTVEDPAFWQGVEPVKFGVLPRLQDSVTVIGYAPLFACLAMPCCILHTVHYVAWGHVFYTDTMITHKYNDNKLDNT